jgi:hypothetical protein
VDVLTGFTLLRPLLNKKTSTIANALFKIFSDFGTPRIIHSDNEATLVSGVLKEFYSILGSHFQTSTPYSPHSLGKAERAVGIAVQCIRKLLSSSGGEWDKLCPFAQLSMNTKIKDLTGSDPFVLMYNRTCNIFSFPNLYTETNLQPATSPVVSLEEWQTHQAKLESIIFPAIRARVTKKNKLANDAYAFTHTKAQMDLPIGTVIAFKDVVRASIKESHPCLLRIQFTLRLKTELTTFVIKQAAYSNELFQSNTFDPYSWPKSQIQKVLTTLTTFSTIA